MKPLRIHLMLLACVCLAGGIERASMPISLPSTVFIAPVGQDGVFAFATIRYSCRVLPRQVHTGLAGLRLHRQRRTVGHRP